MANRRHDKTICDFVKLLFRNFKNKEQLRDLIQNFSFLMKKEQELLVLIYCDSLPVKCAAYKLDISKRWADYLHNRGITKISPYVFSFILNMLSRS